MQRPNDCEYGGMIECDPSARDCDRCGWNPAVRQKLLRQIETGRSATPKGTPRQREPRRKNPSRNRVYILYRYWDTPDNEGTEIIGAYRSSERAIADMRLDAAITRAEYPDDFWEDDYTWEDEFSIHLGCGATSMYDLATIYGWEIEKVEVR